jgi:3'(2'),5'-bisphosphate nucleotidase
LSEESGSLESGHSDVFFLVDPLDGTKEFLKRNGEFTVNIALIANGVPVAGVVVAPALGECYFAAQGLGAWKSVAGKSVPLRVRNYESSAPLRIVGSRSHDAGRLNARMDTLPVPHQFTPVGSSLKFCRVAEGQADIYPRFGPTRQWDTAAAQCVLENAGGCVLDLAGQALRYGFDRPMRNPEFLAMGDNSIFDLFQWARREATFATIETASPRDDKNR